MLNSKFQFYIVCLLLVTVLSCKDKDPNADCGCDGSTIKVIENMKGSYVGNNGLLLRTTIGDSTVAEIYVIACYISDTLKISPDKKKPDYIVSGNIKKDCFYAQTVAIVPSRFEVKSIKSIL